MKKRHFLYTMFFMLLLAAASCDKSPNNSMVRKIKWVDTISRRWVVTESWIDSTPDVIYVGLDWLVNPDGTYNLITASHDGTWEFYDNYKKILIDKDDATNKTTWNIDSLSSKTCRVNFISPFNGSKVIWWMQAK